MREGTAEQLAGRQLGRIEATTEEAGLGAGRMERGETAAEGSATTSASAEEASTQVMDSMSDPEFSLAVEVVYHGERRAFLLSAHRWMMFLAIALGASATVSIWGEHPCGLLAALVAAADIAFDFVGRAQEHAEIRRRYLELVSDVASRGPEAADFSARWTVISADEPPLYKNAEKVAYREVCISQDKVVPDMLPLRQRWSAHLVRG